MGPGTLQIEALPPRPNSRPGGGANRKFFEGPGGTLVVGPRNADVEPRSGVPLRPPPF